MKRKPRIRAWPAMYFRTGMFFSAVFVLLNCGKNPVESKVEKGTLTDIDGNTYQTIKIGDQWWMAENLKVTCYSNGDSIPNVTGDMPWMILATGAYCDYGNLPDSATAYGRLYNWYAVADSRKIAPKGWHVPSDLEWQTLVYHLGGGIAAGGKMKEAGTSHWDSPNAGATNASGFSALPGGYRNYGGSFYYKGYCASFWSSTENNGFYAWYRGLNCSNSEVTRNYTTKVYGFSIRCVMD